MDNTLYDAEARVDAIYPIHMIGDFENPPEWLERLSYDIDVPETMKEMQQFPEMTGAMSPFADFGSSEEVGVAIAEAWARCGRRGFMVSASVCARQYIDPDTYYSGWGITKRIWFFVEEIDQVEPELLKRASALHAKAKAEKAGAA
ncbi:hypothetical protein H4S14_004139 [Agrobacterium vitis]|nr:hypothetical protein [Agrobacterium vitis]MBE1440365.1 hypothetical protein [Agrobacterium vitis]